MPPNQRIPRSLGLTLLVMRMRERLKQQELADILTETTGRFNNRGKIQRSAIGQFEHSQHLLYWELDRYGKWYGLPSGFVYIISRFAANIRDNKVDEARNIAICLKELCDYILNEGDRMAAQDPYADTDKVRTDVICRCLSDYQRFLPDDHPHEPGASYRILSNILKTRVSLESWTSCSKKLPVL